GHNASLARDCGQGRSGLYRLRRRRRFGRYCLLCFPVGKSGQGLLQEALSICLRCNLRSFDCRLLGCCWLLGLCGLLCRLLCLSVRLCFLCWRVVLFGESATLDGCRFKFLAFGIGKAIEYFADKGIVEIAALRKADPSLLCDSFECCLVQS